MRTAMAISVRLRWWYFLPSTDKAKKLSMILLVFTLWTLSKLYSKWSLWEAIKLESWSSRKSAMRSHTWCFLHSGWEIKWSTTLEVNLPGKALSLNLSPRRKIWPLTRELRLNKRDCSKRRQRSTKIYWKSSLRSPRNTSSITTRSKRSKEMPNDISGSSVEEPLRVWLESSDTSHLFLRRSTT